MLGATLGVLRVRWCWKPHWECWEYVPSFRKPYRHRTRHMTGTVCNHQQTLTLPLIPSDDSMHVSGWVGGGGAGGKMYVIFVILILTAWSGNACCFVRERLSYIL